MWRHEDWIPAIHVPSYILANWKAAVLCCTDGSASATTRVGSYAVVTRSHNFETEFSTFKGDTTNSETELLAVLYAIEHCDPSRPLIVISDSMYVLEGASRWLPRWRANFWHNSQGKPVIHRALWERLDKAQHLENRHIHYHHVKGHAGHPGNERADVLCTQAWQAHMQDLLTPA